MNMAEKDETEGRCPACRVPYNKEKIVGMAADCKRLASCGSYILSAMKAMCLMAVFVIYFYTTGWWQKSIWREK